jgi:hypothetical protein
MAAKTLIGRISPERIATQDIHHPAPAVAEGFLALTDRDDHRFR